MEDHAKYICSLFESDKPPISVVDSSIWHYDSSKKSYAPFDKNLYKNIDYDFYQENFEIFFVIQKIFDQRDY